jgi:hypothetical protein
VLSGWTCVYGHHFRLDDLKNGQERTRDVSGAMHPGEDNTAVVETKGPQDKATTSSNSRCVRSSHGPSWSRVSVHPLIAVSVLVRDGGGTFGVERMHRLCAGRRLIGRFALRAGGQSILDYGGAENVAAQQGEQDCKQTWCAAARPTHRARQVQMPELACRPTAVAAGSHDLLSMRRLLHIY